MWTFRDNGRGIEWLHRMVFFFACRSNLQLLIYFGELFFISFFAEAVKYKSNSWSTVLGAVMYILKLAGTCITFQWDKNHCCVLDKRAKFLSCFNGRWHLYCQMDCSTSFLKESPFSVAQNSFSSPSWLLLLPRMGESCAVRTADLQRKVTTARFLQLK